MDIAYQAVFPHLLEKVQAVLSASPACHDWDHTLRVLNNARHLARVEHADSAIVEYAAMLHDMGRPDEFAAPGHVCHAERGEEIALELLPQLGITDSHFIAAVASCVRTHRYRRRSGGVPESIEAKVVFDADKLDSIGAIGIGRSFHFAGRIGARIHNTMVEALDSESYSREDTAYREYLVKLRYITEKMLTAEGRRMAIARHEFMVNFFERICSEVRGEDYF